MIRRRRGRNARQQRQQSQQQRPRMGIRHASRLDRLEEEISMQMHDQATDWRDLDAGPFILSARYAAFLDWVRAERPAVVELLHALPDGARCDDMTQPAVRAWWERMEQAYGEWDAAGQPDPHGHMDPAHRESRIRAHENAVETSASGTTYH